jgi:trimeric autotransporter adhesin
VVFGGTGPAAITGIQVTGPFAIQAGAAGACPTGASTLAVGASCKVAVVFKPTATGTVAGTLSVGSAGTPLAVPLKGLSLAADAGVLSASVALLDFTNPATPLGQVSAARTVTITNGAIAAVSIAAPAVTGPFRLAPASNCGAMLAVNTSCTLSVEFMPATAGQSSGQLSVTTAVGQVLQVALSGATPSAGTPGGGGSAVLVANVMSHGFLGVLGVGSEPKTVTFTNAGSTPLVIQDINTAGPFEVANTAINACRTTVTLAAGASCDIAVVFRAPMSTGTSTGTLTVTAAARGGATTESRSVGLEGMAVVTNAGGRSDDLQSGGGAIDLVALLLGFAAVLVARRARRPSRFL